MNENEKKEIGIEATAGNKAVYLVDLKEKRKRKSPTSEFLNFIERYPSSSLKDIENGLIKNKTVKESYATALAVRKAKGSSEISLRDFVKGRIRKLVAYFLAPNIVKDEFGGKFPLLKEVSEGKETYRLGVYTE